MITYPASLSEKSRETDVIMYFQSYPTSAPYSVPYRVVSGVTYKSKDKLHIGDKVTPLSWFNGTVSYLGAREHEQYRQKSVSTPTYPYSKLVVFKYNWYNDVWAVNKKASPYISSKFLEGFPLSPPADYAMADKEALIRLNQCKFDTGVFVAELGETVSYFAQKAFLAATLLHCIRTGKYEKALALLGIGRRRFERSVKDARRISPAIDPRGTAEYANAIAGQIAARYLELQFAINPLIYDLNDAQSLVGGALLDVSTSLFAVKGKFKHVDNTDGVVGGVHRKHNVTIHTVTKLYARVDGLEETVEKSLGLSSYVPAIWEIMPMSWLIDYVIDIGDFLNAYMAVKGLSFVNGYHSTRIQGTTTEWYYSANNMADGVPPVNGSVRTKEIQTVVINTYRRDVMSAFPHPRISFVLDDISSGKIANVIALAGVLFTSRNKNYLGKL